MGKPTDSLMGTLARMRWPRPVVSMCRAQCGIRDVVDVLRKVPSKLSVEKLDCWIWRQVKTLNGISVLSLALCMVLAVIFPAGGKVSPKLLVSNLLAALEVARLRVASQSVHPPRWACRVLRMLPPRWLQEKSPIRRVPWCCASGRFAV